MGKGCQPSALSPTPNLEDQTRGPHLVWSLSLDLFDMGGRTRVKDSSRHSTMGRRDTQTTPPR